MSTDNTCPDCGAQYRRGDDHTCGAACAECGAHAALRETVAEQADEIAALRAIVDRIPPGLLEPAPGEHRHERVYSGMTYATYPSQSPWICATCGHEGVDRGSGPAEPGMSYKELLAKWGKPK